MDRWEYRIEEADPPTKEGKAALLGHLNALGLDGWEAVSLDNFYYVLLKRRITDRQHKEV